MTVPVSAHSRPDLNPPRELTIALKGKGAAVQRLIDDADLVGGARGATCCVTRVSSPPSYHRRCGGGGGGGGGGE